MAERSAEGGRRASVAMYDPLRDIYTTVSENQGLTERDARHAALVGVSESSQPGNLPGKEALSNTDSSVGSLRPQFSIRHH
jgi:hypothetical protein